MLKSCRFEIHKKKRGGKGEENKKRKKQLKRVTSGVRKYIQH